MSNFRRPRFELKIGSRSLCLGRETKIMAVLNVTPDSFSDGGKYLDPSKAERQAMRMQDEGAHFLDIGGESSRPGSKRISVREETRRVLPALKRLAGKVQVPISIDTTKYDVAKAALDHGAAMVNDITALTGDKRMAKLIARYQASVVLLHMQGRPGSMQKDPRYKNVVAEVRTYLGRAAERAQEAGISRSRIVLDPGFGFGKTLQHNLSLLAGLDEFASLGLPILVGLSRKSFIGQVLQTSVEQRLPGSLAAAAVAVQKGAHILRVHDVVEHRQLSALVDRVLEDQEL